MDIKFTGIVEKKAWFALGKKRAVALDELGTTTFLDKDIDGLNKLYSMHWESQMDANNSLFLCCKSTSEVHNLINREISSPETIYTSDMHVDRMESLMKTIREEADIMLAIRAAIYILENNPPIVVDARRIKE